MRELGGVSEASGSGFARGIPSGTSEASEKKTIWLRRSPLMTAVPILSSLLDAVVAVEL